ncbi:1271_t:CDS:1, partial [Ambispora leptoticha]
MGLSSFFSNLIFHLRKLNSSSQSTLTLNDTSNPNSSNNKRAESPTSTQPIPKITIQLNTNLVKFKYQLPNTKNSFAINLCHLPEDVFQEIAEFLDLLSLLALRSTCRTLYYIFPDKKIFSKIFFSLTTDKQLQSLFIYLQSTESLKFVQQFTVYKSPITHESVISILKNCENLQQINIVGGRDVAPRKVTKALVKWKQDGSGDSPNLASLKRILMTRCVGGNKRHNYKAQKMDNDMKELDHEIFQLVDCDELN